MLNTLLYLYLGETAFVWIEGIVHQILLDRKLKKEGFKFTQKKYFSFGDVFLTLMVIIVHSIPLFNLVFPISHIPFHRSYDEHKNYLLEAGAIIEPDDDIVEKIDSKKIKAEVINKDKIVSHDIYQPLYRDDSYHDDLTHSYQKRYHRRMH